MAAAAKTEASGLPFSLWFRDLAFAAVGRSGIENAGRWLWACPFRVGTHVAAKPSDMNAVKKRTPAVRGNPMRRCASVRMACVVWCLPWSLLPTASMHAEDYAYETNNGTITITAYNGPGGEVSIPDTAHGLPVTCIGDSAFGGRRDVTGVICATSNSGL